MEAVGEEVGVVLVINEFVVVGVESSDDRLTLSMLVDVTVADADAICDMLANNEDSSAARD